MVIAKFYVLINLGDIIQYILISFQLKSAAVENMAAQYCNLRDPHTL